jgi:hypothetical protein
MKSKKKTICIVSAEHPLKSALLACPPEADTEFLWCFPWEGRRNRIAKKLIHFGFGALAHKLGSKAFRNIHADAYVILEAPGTGVMLDWLKRNRPHARTAVWLWNYFRPEALPEFTDLAQKHPDVSFYTFDRKNEAEGLIGYLDQFYLPILRNFTPSEEFDLFFIGKNKGREALVRDIERKCASFTQENRITVFNDRVKGTSDEITYEENLCLAASCRVMIDITNAGQSGLTLRVLEALFYGKKLITNNAEVKSHPFYDPARILILDEKNPPAEGALRAFILGAPAKPADSALLKRYSMEKWLEGIFKPVPGRK